MSCLMRSAGKTHFRKNSHPVIFHMLKQHLSILLIVHWNLTITFTPCNLSLMTGKINSNLNNQISLQSAESLDTNTQVRKQSLPLRSKRSRLHKDRSSKSSLHCGSNCYWHECVNSFCCTGSSICSSETTS